MNTPIQVPPYPPGRNLLAGKNVLVTAAAGTGIGFATARRCLEEGARVYVSDLHERRLAEAVERLRAIEPDLVEGRLCDVTREPDVRALIAAAMAAMGRVDVLVNNAGLGGSVAVTEMTDEQWHKVLDVSLTSVFRMSRAVLPHMYANGQRCHREQRFRAWRGAPRRCRHTTLRPRPGSWLSRVAWRSRRPSTACASMRSPPASRCTHS